MLVSFCSIALPIHFTKDFEFDFSWNSSAPAFLPPSNGYQSPADPGWPCEWNLFWIDTSKRIDIQKAVVGVVVSLCVMHFWRSEVSRDG